MPAAFTLKWGNVEKGENLEVATETRMVGSGTRPGDCWAPKEVRFH